jgi:hypothetical protein
LRQHRQLRQHFVASGQAPKSRPCLKPAPLSIAATTALEMIGPTPCDGQQAVAAVILLHQRFDLGRYGRKFDGEFASHSSTYAGTGTVRVAW